MHATYCRCTWRGLVGSGDNIMCDFSTFTAAVIVSMSEMCENVTENLSEMCEIGEYHCSLCNAAHALVVIYSQHCECVCVCVCVCVCEGSHLKVTHVREV